MPTGYTYPISDGITFEQFALNCARAFGACVTMRDDPSDTPIPDEFVPSDYHLKAGEEATTEMRRVLGMTDADAEQAAEAEYRKTAEYNARRILECDELKAKYEAMLAAVDAWNPPTPDHVEMKNFMRDQIIKSIEWDCGKGYYLENAPVRKSGSAWRAEKLKTLGESVVYHEKNYAEEVERARTRTAWVKALRESLRKAGER